MRTRTSTYQANGYGSEDYGKCICVSFPNHETDLIEEADIQTKLTGSASRSHLFRMYLRDMNSEAASGRLSQHSLL